MPVEIFIDGALSPVVVNEPFFATHTNLGAAMKNGSLFFLTKDMNKNVVSVNISRILYMREIDED